MMGDEAARPPTSQATDSHLSHSANSGGPTVFARLIRLAFLLEMLVIASLIGLRLSSTRVDSPRLDDYCDALTATELRNLAERYLFDSGEKFRVLGEAYLTFGFYSKADGCLRRACSANPGDVETKFLRAFCLERFGKLDEAIALMSEVAEASPKLAAEAKYHIGRDYLRLERPEQADAAFAAAGPRHYSSVYQRAKLHLRSGRVQEAEAFLNALNTAHPRDLHVVQLRTRWEQLTGKPPASEQPDPLERTTSELKLDDSPEQLNAIRDRFGMPRAIAEMNAVAQSGNFVAAANRVFKLTASDTGWRNRLPWLLEDSAQFQLRAKNVAAARREIDRQFQQENMPTPRAWQLLGDIEFAANNLPAAWEAWQHAERMLPTSDLSLRLAQAANRQGHSEAEHQFAALLGKQSGIAAFRANDVRGARATLKRSLEFSDSQPEVWFYLGETARLENDELDAIASYKRCLQLAPNHTRAKQRLGPNPGNRSAR